MVAQSDDWAKLLYTYRFDHKIGLRELPGKIQPHIDEWNKTHPDNPLLPFSSKAASKHFLSHVPAAITMQYQAQNQMSVTKRAKATSQIPAAVQQQVAIQTAKSVKVFEEMQTLFNQLKKLFDKYLHDKPEISALSIHLDIIREMRKTLTEIGKVRQSKELVKIAVRSVIDTFLSRLIEDLGKKVDDLHAKVLKKTGDAAFAAEIAQDFKGTIVDTTIEAAKVAISRVKVEFALEDDDQAPRPT